MGLDFLRSFWISKGWRNLRLPGIMQVENGPWDDHAPNTKQDQTGGFPLPGIPGRDSRPCASDGKCLAIGLVQRLFTPPPASLFPTNHSFLAISFTRANNRSFLSVAKIGLQRALGKARIPAEAVEAFWTQNCGQALNDWAAGMM